MAETRTLTAHYEGPNGTSLWFVRDPLRPGVAMLRILEHGLAPVDLASFGPKALRWLACAANEAADRLLADGAELVPTRLRGAP